MAWEQIGERMFERGEYVVVWEDVFGEPEGWVVYRGEVFKGRYQTRGEAKLAARRDAGEAV